MSENPTTYFDQHQYPVSKLYGTNHSVQNNKYFQDYDQGISENNQFDFDHLNEKEHNLSDVWINIQLKLEKLRNHYYSYNPYLVNTSSFNEFRYQVNTFIMYLAKICILKKSSYSADRLLKNLGYTVD